MKGLNILLADDDPMVLNLLDRMVRRMGHHPDAVLSSVEAVNHLQKKDYDVVITDLRLDTMTGLEVLRLIKPICPYTVSIILTGQGSPDDTLAALKAGVFDFIEKPIPSAAFLEAVVERAGHRSRLLRERDRLLESLRQKSSKQQEHIRQLGRAYARLRDHENERDADLLRAQRIQQRLLPPGFPGGRGFEYFACYFPCELLGGDFFDIVCLDDDDVALLLADVAGHGVGAAMLTVMIRQLIHACLLESGSRELLRNPPGVMEYLNEGLFEQQFDDPHHVTMVYILLNTKTGEFRLSNAGHVAPLVLRVNASPLEVDVSGPGIGISRESVFEVTAGKLKVGERLFVYSDGLGAVLEGGAVANESETSVHRRLSELMTEGGGCLELGRRMIDRIRLSAGEHAPEDDVSFFLFGPVKEEMTPFGELIPGSVEILRSNRSRSAVQLCDHPIASGRGGDVQVVHLQGKCTWKHAHTIIKLLNNPRIRTHYLNLMKCESLDSTLLGTLIEHADHLVICSPGDGVIRQFDELGIRNLVRISGSPVPELPITIPREEKSDFASDTEVVYKAHKTLIRVNPENDERFRPVVAELGKELASLRGEAGRKR